MVACHGSAVDKLPAWTEYALIMASERTQRQIDRLLDEAEEAITEEDWSTVGSRARAVLALIQRIPMPSTT